MRPTTQVPAVQRQHWELACAGRLRNGEYLGKLGKNPHYFGATYVAGYSIEIYLKLAISQVKFGLSQRDPWELLKPEFQNGWHLLPDPVSGNALMTFYDSGHGLLYWWLVT